MTLKILILPIAVMTVLLPLHASCAAKSAKNLIKEPPHRIYHVIQHKTLKEATQQISQRSGISFTVNAADQDDLIDRKLAAEDWTAALVQLLHGYNYTTQSVDGKVQKVIITGENGNGNSSADLVQIPGAKAATLPSQYQHFKPGSVMPVKLPLAQLKAMAVGKKLTLDLPIGQYTINHDNLVKHEDGSSTWLGYLDQEGKGYRFYLSEGEAGLMGAIYTPDGEYNIDSVDGETYLVDLANSGLDDAGYEHDQAEITQAPALIAPPVLPVRQAPPSAAAITTTSISSTTTTSYTSTSLANFKGPVIDLMVIYTTEKQTASYARQRIQDLVARSNQAYIDSKINLRLRLVHTRRTNYPESTDNGIALSDLAHNKGSFYYMESLRWQYGADLVMLFRPLYGKTSGSCGMTYIGFSNGSAANARYGYGTISDGRSKDALTTKYCGDKTFTHEIGHSFGNVHDREYSNVPGKHPYSYAWGINGKFGTIMSYKGPNLMLFSSPVLSKQCNGLPCGYPPGDARASDQARSMNSAAPWIAQYRPVKLSQPVLY